MNTLQKIINTINSINDLPDFFKLIQTDISKHSTRLYYLLYGKDNNYEGPLYNGIQETEWPMITLLITNWLIETIHLIKPDDYKKKIQQKLFLEYNIITVATKIVIAFLKNNIFPISDDDKNYIILILENEYIIKFLNNEVEIIFNKIKQSCGCCFSTSKKSIIKLTNETGNKCTFVNSLKSITSNVNYKSKYEVSLARLDKQENYINE